MSDGAKVSRWPLAEACCPAAGSWLLQASKDGVSIKRLAIVAILRLRDIVPPCQLLELVRDREPGGLPGAKATGQVRIDVRLGGRTLIKRHARALPAKAVKHQRLSFHRWKL